MQPRNMSMSGVVDLAAVKAAGEAKAEGGAGPRGSRRGRAAAVPSRPPRLVIDVDEAGFETRRPPALRRGARSSSTSGPSGASRASSSARSWSGSPHEYAGRFVLAKIDVDANQMLMQQFGVQGIPAVFAVVAGQALPLFQGAAPESRSARPSTS